MKLTGIPIAFLLVIALVLTGRPAVAAQAVEKQTDGQTLVSSGMTAVELKKDGDPQPPEDKPKKSKKNDGKDGDPDDGNAGGGNDGQTVPDDGPVND